jgi:hypothetical protein
VHVAVLAAAILLTPVLAAAQALGSVAGTVKDASGAILPGVTVEVASPALIEKVRTGTTDGSGQYRIIALPPGDYTVTFTLTALPRSSARTSRSRPTSRRPSTARCVWAVSRRPSR